jgi:hypothetical protein
MFKDKDCYPPNLKLGNINEFIFWFENIILIVHFLVSSYIHREDRLEHLGNLLQLS